jgi:signal transduction histidine kinase
MLQAQAATKVSAEQLRQLDALMLDLAAGFIGLPAERIDRGIEDGLRRVVHTLGVDRCAISRAHPDTGDIRFSWAWPDSEFPRSPTRVVSEHWPWAVSVLRRGETVVFTRLDELPPQAHVDRAAWAAMGTRSHVTVPLMRDGVLVAMLHLGNFRVERLWPEPLLARLRRVAEIFSIALTRKHDQQALERARGFEHAATATLQALLAAKPGADAAAVEAGLAEVGRLLRVDWVALWEADAAGAALRGTHEWWAGARRPALLPRSIPLLPWLAAQFAAGRHASCDDVAALPDSAGADRAMLRGWGLRSLLAVPVSGGGMLCCARLKEPRAWPDNAVHGVRLLAEVFASLRARRLAEKREQAAVMDAAQWRERLAHLVRVHTVGEMSAALAHEINQPLMAIANYAIAARRRADALPQSDKVAELIDKVIVQTTRAGDVVARLRGMVKRNEIQARAVDFALLVDGCLDMVRMECELRDIRLQRRVASPLPPLVADGIQLQQVVLNLLRNAIEAMELAPPEAPREIGIEVAAVDGRELRVSVTDRGPGIGEADLERVFEAFYSTKVSGLGIGLSLCRKLIEAHGGTLAARDRPDGGAEFTFTLPAGDGH